MNQYMYDIAFKQIDGSPASLGNCRGKVWLVVNVASKCGLTPHYSGLEKLFQDKRKQGLEVRGFPANDFKEQEPSSDDQIATFCSKNYDVHFQLFAKVSVVGADQHLLYARPTTELPESTVDRQGR
jgi:glutathione peroxidase